MNLIHHLKDVKGLLPPASLHEREAKEIAAAIKNLTPFQREIYKEVRTQALPLYSTLNLEGNVGSIDRTMIEKVNIDLFRCCLDKFPINLGWENALCKELETLKHRENTAAVTSTLSPLQNKIVTLQKLYRAHMLRPKLKDLALAAIRYHYIEARFNQAIGVPISEQDPRLTNLQALRQMAPSFAESWISFDPIIRLKTQNPEGFVRAVERSVEHKS